METMEHETVMRVMAQFGSTPFPPELQQPPQWTIVDKTTYRTAEVDRLVSTIPTLTTLGSEALRSSVVDGIYDLAEIHRRQDAVAELGENVELAGAISGGLASIADGEEEFSKFLTQTWPREFEAKQRYKTTKEVSAAIADIGNLAEPGEDSTPQAPKLKQLIETVQAYQETEIFRLLEKSVYNTPRGLRSSEDLIFCMPRLKFRPGFITGRVVIPLAAAVGFFNAVPEEITTGALGEVFMLGSLSSIGAFYSKPQRDGRMLYKLGEKFMDTPEAVEAVRAISEIDELMALRNFGGLALKAGNQVVIPQVTEADWFCFRATDLTNPLLAAQPGREVVGNDIDLGAPSNNRLTLLTGPNSGGKSTISKAVILNQILAQIGGPVTAEAATVSVADKIAYHVPTPPDLQDETGRFGYELGRVREILDDASKDSLSVLDDCLDGTTHEERLIILKNVILGFRNLSGSTLFSTHAHEMVSVFEQAGVGQLLQVEFDGEKPTYSIKPGVSHTSHASRVAEQVGFTEAQMKEEISGVDNPVWF